MSEIFPDLGKLIDGELHSGSFLIIGPPHSGKRDICFDFVCNCINMEHAAVYVTTNYDAETIISHLPCGQKLDAARQSLRVIDYYSAQAGLPIRDSKISVVGPENLTDLSIDIDRVRKDLAKHAHFIFDSITTLATRFGEDAITRFIQIIVGRVREARGLGIYLLEEGAHSEFFYNRLKALFDGIIELRIIDTPTGEVQRLLRVFHVMGHRYRDQWVPVVLTDRGVKLVTEDQLRCEFSAEPLLEMPYKVQVGGVVRYFKNKECAEGYERRMTFLKTFLR